GLGSNSITIQGLAADQTVHVQSGSFTGATGNADDTVTIGNNGDISGMKGTVDVRNSSAAPGTTLVIDDSRDSVPTPRTIRMNWNSVSFSGLGTINYAYGEMKAVTINGGPYGNTFNVLGAGAPSWESTVPFTTTINAGSGGDTVNVSPQ